MSVAGLSNNDASAVRAACASATDRLRLTIIGAPPLPPGVTPLLGGTAWCDARVRPAAQFDVAADSAATDLLLCCDDACADAVLSAMSQPGDAARGLPPMIHLTDRGRDAREAPCGVVTFGRDAGHAQIRGAVLALLQSKPAMDRIAAELTSLYALGSQLHTHFDEMQRDMTLAARLQRDFLPRQLPDAPGLQFATLYRPCNWISGDILDVFRIDEHHVGFYVMDAMGHGVSAALLTMFLRNAIRPAQPCNPDDWMRPGQVMAHLNEVLINEKLSDCQFVTGWYGVLDTRTRVLTYCNGGHPPALRIDRNRRVQSLRGEGCLLGVFTGKVFPDCTATLEAGDRLLVFSDGLEPALFSESDEASPPVLSQPVQDLLCNDTETFSTEMAAYLDRCPGAFSQRADDVSLVIVDMAG